MPGSGMASASEAIGIPPAQPGAQGDGLHRLDIGAQHRRVGHRRDIGDHQPADQLRLGQGQRHGHLAAHGMADHRGRRGGERRRGLRHIGRHRRVVHHRVARRGAVVAQVERDHPVPRRQPALDRAPIAAPRRTARAAARPARPVPASTRSAASTTVPSAARRQDDTRPISRRPQHVPAQRLAEPKVRDEHAERRHHQEADRGDDAGSRRPASIVAQVPIGAAMAPTKAACGQAASPIPPAGSCSSASGSSSSDARAKHQGSNSSTGRRAASGG